MTSNGKWKNNFKDFFFEKGGEGAEKLLEKGKEDAEKLFEKGKEGAEKLLEKGKEDSEKLLEKGAEGAKKLRENAEDALSNGCSSSDPGKEDIDEETNEGLTDESKCLLETNPPPGTLKGRLFRMFSKPTGRDDEGEQTGANDDDDKTVVTNGQTNQVQMVDKAVSTEDKDDIPEDEVEDGNTQTESSDVPATATDATAPDTVNEEKVEEKKRFRFQLFSK